MKRRAATWHCSVQVLCKCMTDLRHGEDVDDMRARNACVLSPIIREVLVCVVYHEPDSSLLAQLACSFQLSLAEQHAYSSMLLSWAHNLSKLCAVTALPVFMLRSHSLLPMQHSLHRHKTRSCATSSSLRSYWAKQATEETKDMYASDRLNECRSVTGWGRDGQWIVG